MPSERMNASERVGHSLWEKHIVLPLHGICYSQISRILQKSLKLALLSYKTRHYQEYILFKLLQEDPNEL